MCEASTPVKVRGNSNERSIISSSGIASTPFERILALICGLLTVTVAVALLRGAARWGQLPPILWAHLATVSIALALTPAILLMARGTRAHRMLGAIWMLMMVATAILSFFVRVIRPGHLSPIHVFSVVTLVTVPAALWFAHAHQIDRHRRMIRGTIIGALLIAGWLTFPFGRLLGRWLLG